VVLSKESSPLFASGAYTTGLLGCTTRSTGTSAVTERSPIVDVCCGATTVKGDPDEPAEAEWTFVAELPRADKFFFAFVILFFYEKLSLNRQR
jgi:hypothetical protein